MKRFFIVLLSLIVLLTTQTTEAQAKSLVTGLTGNGEVYVLRPGLSSAKEKYAAKAMSGIRPEFEVWRKFGEGDDSYYREVVPGSKLEVGVTYQLRVFISTEKELCDTSLGIDALTRFFYDEGELTFGWTYSGTVGTSKKKLGRVEFAVLGQESYLIPLDTKPKFGKVATVQGFEDIMLEAQTKASPLFSEKGLAIASDCGKSGKIKEDGFVRVIADFQIIDK